MQTGDFEFLADMIEVRSGLIVSADQGYLIESRLMPLAQRFGCPGTEALIAKLRVSPTDEMVGAVTEAMAMSETTFYREKQSLDHFLKHNLSGLIKARLDRKRLSFWCAGVSTGQEAYSLAMSLEAVAESLPGWKLDILATDLNQAALTKAETGTYSQFEVQRGLPIKTLLTFFTQKNDVWTLSHPLAARISFKHQNLLEEGPEPGSMDVIFLRHVLCDLSSRAQGLVAERLKETLADDGVLILGEADPLEALSPDFERGEGNGLPVLHPRGGVTDADRTPAGAVA